MSLYKFEDGNSRPRKPLHLEKLSFALSQLLVAIEEDAVKLLIEHSDSMDEELLDDLCYKLTDFCCEELQRSKNFMGANGEDPAAADGEEYETVDNSTNSDGFEERFRRMMEGSEEDE